MAEEDAVDGTIIEIGDLAISFVEQGQGITVLYVHGNVTSGRFYERVMDVPGVHAIALDMPNFGRSKPLPGEPDLDRYADAVAAFVRARGLDRPVIVGHSLGGGVVMSLAARFPQLPRALVLVDSIAPSGLATPPERFPLIEAMRNNRPLVAALLKAQMPTLGDEAFFQALVDEGMKMADGAWGLAHARALGSFDYRGRTAAFTGPVLVAWGRKDLLVTEAMARETAAAFPDAKLEIVEDVGHSVIVEDPKRFVSLIVGFIRDRRLAP
jgi:branched-chain amino acid transport system permease protein